MSVRQMWKAKLEGKSLPSPVAVPGRVSDPGSHSPSGAAAMDCGLAPSGRPFAGKVLGIDPSLRGTGLALLEFVPGRQPLMLHSRTVSVPSSRSMAAALAEIHRAVTRFLTEESVVHVALEQTIYVQNIRTAQILGAARGAAIAAAALQGLEVFEYPPRRVKQAVTGSGRASKTQVARMVMGLLGHGRTLSPDEADAASVALCHAMTWRG